MPNCQSRVSPLLFSSVQSQTDFRAGTNLPMAGWHVDCSFIITYIYTFFYKKIILYKKLSRATRERVLIIFHQYALSNELIQWPLPLFLWIWLFSCFSTSSFVLFHFFLCTWYCNAWELSFLICMPILFLLCTCTFSFDLDSFVHLGSDFDIIFSLVDKSIIGQDFCFVNTFLLKNINFPKILLLTTNCMNFLPVILPSKQIYRRWRESPSQNLRWPHR